MCYTCTYSLCKVCITQGKFFSVRGTKGFCDTCFGTIYLIESKDESATKVDFDDVNSWEYLFKLYWSDLKSKLSLTMEELTNAKDRWSAPNTSARKEKAESSDDLYDINNDDDAGSDCSSRKRRRTNSSRKKGQKRRKVNSDCSIAAKEGKQPIGDAGSLPTEVPSEVVSLPVDIKWASPELLELIGHMRDGDQSLISKFDIQNLLLEYIKKYNLRDPQRKSQIICDTRLHCLFMKTRVAHFEMLKLLESHYVVNETPRINGNSQVTINLNPAQIDTNGDRVVAAKSSPDKRRRMHRKMEREPQVNVEAYAAVDMHNINLIYMRRSLMEDVMNDATFSDKIRGAFVRIKISGIGQKQDMYRLVKVVGTHKVPEKYSIGKKTTNLALEILNLDKKEIIKMDTISNQGFTEEECKRLRQSMKCGLISRLKVGDIQEKAKTLQSVRVNDWFENEKQKLGHLRDRASEKGRKKELRECVEKLQLLNNSEERARRINEVLEVHVDSHMDPNYESSEEMDNKKDVGRNGNWTRSDTSISRRMSKYLNTMQNHPQKNSVSDHRPKKMSMESMICGSGAGAGAGRKFENSTKTNSTLYKAGSLTASGVTMSIDMEPEKVWHYKDPSGNVQGPFTLLQLSKWTTYFPHDLRVWLTFESEERSLLLTEVLSKQQKDFTKAASLTSRKATLAGTGYNMNSPSVDQTNALSPVGYSMLNSSVVTVQPNKCSVPERESVNSPDDCLSLSTSSVPPKDLHTVNSQAHCQTKHSVFTQSPGSPYGQGGCSGESNHRHNSGALWSPTTAEMSCSGQGIVESHPNLHVSWSQCQHDSRNSSLGGYIKDLNSRADLSKNLPTQRVLKDVPSPVFAWSPSESRTASSQHEGSCLSSTTNPSFLDELHSSIASANPKSCAPATPIEDRGSSSPSGMLSHSERVPISSPQSAPLASPSGMCKIQEIVNQQRTLEADISNASVNQSPHSKIFPESSPDNQDIDREFPSPTPRSEIKEPAVDNSGLTPASPENGTIACSPGSDTRKMEEIVSQQNTLEVNASNSSVNHSLHSKVLPASSPDNKNLEHEYPNSTPRHENKVPSVDNSLLASAASENTTTASPSASDTCPVLSPDNTNLEREYPNSTPRHENKVPSADNSLLASADPENVITSPSASDTCPASSPDNTNPECEYPNSTPRHENKVSAANNSLLTSAAPGNAITTSPSASDTCPASSSDNTNIECEYPDSAPRHENKVSAADNSLLTSAAPENVTTTSPSASDTCKIEEFVNQQKKLGVDASKVPLNQPHHPNIFPVSSPDNQDFGREYHSPTPRSDSKEPLVDNSVLTSATPEKLPTTSTSASDTCKMEILNEKITFEINASNSSLKRPPHPNNSPLPSPDNQDIECEYSSPNPISESKEPLVDNLGLTSSAAENLTCTSASASDICKMEETLNRKTVLEANLSNGSVTESPQSKVFPVFSPDIVDVEPEFPISTPGPEIEVPVVDSFGLTSAATEKSTIKQPGYSPDPFVSPKPGPLTGELGAMESNLKGEEIIQRELYFESESTVVTREYMVIDPSCGAESIDVSDVLESLMEQKCETLHMQGTIALEDFLAASAKEELQCSSPMALSPWGEPSYYQGDALDSAIWDVQDDPINDMWPLLSPTPALQPSSGIETEGKEIYGINEVAVAHNNNEIVQRGLTAGELNVNKCNLGSATNFVLPEQVTAKPNDTPISSADESTVVGWQQSANQNLSAGTTCNTSHNLNLTNDEKAEPSSKSYLEASRKQESADSSVSSSGEAIGSTNKVWNPPSGNANRGSQRSHHHRDRYSQISESWLLSSNHFRNRSDRFGSGGSSRSTLKGQTRRGRM